VRECGDCSLCCKVVPVPQLEKPKDEWCKHCAPGKGGCLIFGQEERPYACGAYQCMWTRQYDWPEWLKPSQSRVVFERVTDTIMLGTCDPDMPDHWKKSAGFKRLLKKWASSGTTVVLRAGDEYHTFLPKGVKPKDVWDTLMEKREAWLHQATPKTSQTSP
jgi:hypothetical protein